jgi:hypothetical protein
MAADVLGWWPGVWAVHRGYPNAMATPHWFVCSRRPVSSRRLNRVGHHANTTGPLAPQTYPAAPTATERVAGQFPAASLSPLDVEDPAPGMAERVLASRAFSHLLVIGLCRLVGVFLPVCGPDAPDLRGESVAVGIWLCRGSWTGACSLRASGIVG